MSERCIHWWILIAATCVAVVGATDHASSWNDGSRLATVECLVDHGTWIIDRSIFVVAPLETCPHPYGNQAAEFPHGTLDKLFIDGHYYSDKPPVPALLTAGPYWLWRACGGPSAAARPDWFCWCMTLCTSGLAYVVAIVCTNALARRIALPAMHRLMVIAAFAFGTLALPYSRSVNNHELLLGVTAALLLALERSSFLCAGLLAGLAYTIDLGAGPVICAGTMTYILAFQIRQRPIVAATIRQLALIGMVTMLFPALHHSLNYYIGGTWRPANANAAYFEWPGCPFDASTMSGAWNHSSPLAFMGYSLDLLVGKKGFWGHNLPLLIALPLLAALLRHQQPRRGLVVLCLAWSVGVWVIYAAGSRNYSGACVSVRWYVPLVSPLMYAAMLALRVRPKLFGAMVWLTLCGTAINTLAWWHGPWHGRMIVGYWAWYALGVVGAMWLMRRVRTPGERRSVSPTWSLLPRIWQNHIGLIPARRDSPFTSRYRTD